MNSLSAFGVTPVRRLVVVLAMVVALVAGGVIVSNGLSRAKAAGVGTKETVTGGSAPEGDHDHPGKITFTVSASGIFLSADTVHYKTVDGTGANGAVAGQDYVKAEGDLTFSAAGDKTVVVTLIGDDIAEGDETFALEISGGSVGSTPARATGTITNDDVNASVADSSILEGTGGTTTAHVVISLTSARNAVTDINYATNNGTAKDTEDYTATSGTVHIPANTTTATIDIPVIADAKYEDDETFGFTITSATAAVTVPSGKGFAVVTIDDDDTPPEASAQPSFSVTDVTVTEGNSGTVAANFTVKLSAASEHTQTVHIATGDGTATAPDDYAAKSDVISFGPNELSKTFAVLVKGDTLDEANETFKATLSAPSAGAKLTDDVMGIATITDDDATPTITVANASGDEGGKVTFTITMSTIAGRDENIAVATANGTASEPGDYTKVPVGTTIVIPAGTTSKTFGVDANTDTVDEPDETFAFFAATEKDTPGQFNDPVTAVGTIKDKTNPPQLSIADVAKDEGNEGTTDFTFPVTLAGSSTQPVTVAYATSIDTGAAHPAAADDFTATTGTLTFAAGETAKNVVVPVNGDTASEENETFKVTLTNPQNATIQDGSAVGTIKNDDAPVVHSDFITTGAGAGAGAHVREFNAAGTPQPPEGFFPYGDGPGVRVARGDLDGDGHDELIVGPGPGIEPVVRVFTGNGSAEIAQVDAYPGFMGGVFVAAGDVDGDGKAEVITGAGPGGGPHVRTFSLQGTPGNRQLVGSAGFMGADTSHGYSGGVTVAAGDLVHSGTDQIIVGLASNDKPIVSVWSYDPSTATPTFRNFFLAYDESFRGGVSVAVGDLDGDGRAEIVTGAGPGGGPHVRVFNAAGNGLPGSAYAYDPNFHGGVNVAIGDIDGDGANEIITAAGPGGGPHVRAFDVLMQPLPTSFMAYGVGFAGGVYVAAGRS